MSLRDNLSRLSPNEFLEKMQDMFQMYQESQEDYYEEGLNQVRKDLRNSDSDYNKGPMVQSLESIKQNMAFISRFIERLYAKLKNKKVDPMDIMDHMKNLLENIPLKVKFKLNNLSNFLYILESVAKELGKFPLDPLITKHWDLQDKLKYK